MPDLDDHAQLKEAHPELVMFQDLLAERPDATWNEVLVRLLEPVHWYLLCQLTFCTSRSRFHVLSGGIAWPYQFRNIRSNVSLCHVAADASACRL